jgi:predicted HicB family RNase H-like nuclease
MPPKKKAKAPMTIAEKVDIRLRVDPELHDRIQAAADQEGNAVAAFIRSAVVKELKLREEDGRRNPR